MRRVDWAGWLKSKWIRSKRSLGQRPRWVVESSPRVSHHDLGGAVEFLERRELLAAVARDGGGDGVRWSDPLNWSNNVLPAAADDVTIDVGNNTIEHDAEIRGPVNGRDADRQAAGRRRASGVSCVASKQ